VVVLNCSNNPPGASISSPSSGLTTVNSTTVAGCTSAGTITFNLNPTDADNDKISMAVSGLPSGASLTVSGNGGYTPSGSFSWNLTGVTPGTYTFYVTYTDDGCPLSSKQSLAYTIVVSNGARSTFTLLSAATCVAKAQFTVSP